MVNIGSDIKLSPLDMHAHSGEPLFLDPPYSGTPPAPGAIPHMPSPPAPRMEYYEPQQQQAIKTRKNQQQEYFIFQQQELPHLQYRDLNELKRQYMAAAQQQPQIARRTAPNLGDQWQAAQALRNALDEVANSRLPVFSGLGTA